MGETELELAAAGARDERSAAGTPFRLRLVAHDPEAYRLFYGVVANPVLWFVQHGLWDLKRDPDADLTVPWRDGYVAANRAIAEAAVEELDRVPGAALYVHDYHLYLVPSLVRELRPDARIAFFVHIPWVGPDAWAVLPREIARAVHASLLTCDSVGFHTEQWRSAFVASCDALLDRGRNAEDVSHANPIAVDTAEFDTLAASEAVRARRAEIQEDRPEILVVRVDRTDPSKNAVRGFEAFGRLLEREPTLHGRVVLLALLDPSRQEIPEYVDYRDATENAAAGGERTVRAAGLAARPARGQRRLPRIGRRVHGVRRPPHQPRDGRAEPRREGGAARQRPERRARPLATGGGVRGARRVGDRRRAPGRRRPGRRARPGDRACGPTSGARGSRGSARASASTTSAPGPTASSRSSRRGRPARARRSRATMRT